MISTAQSPLEECIAALGDGTLTADGLREAFAAASAANPADRPRVQSLMYAAAYENTIFAGLAAISIFAEGERLKIAADPAAWPYHSIVDAMRDGWRIVKFPEFVPDESRNYGLGCEFILEK